MIDLSITTKSAAKAPPATSASATAPGGFARALGALADDRSSRPAPAEARHGDAGDGKKLPHAAADATETPPAVPARPHPVAARRQGKAGTASAPVHMAHAAATGAKGATTRDAKAPASDEAASDDDTPSPAAAITAAPVAPTMIDPALLPVTSDVFAPTDTDGTTGPMGAAALPATATSPTTPLTVPLASDAVIAAPATPDTTAAPGAALPADAALLDPGVATAVKDPAAIADVVARRIETPAQAPRFTLAPAVIVTEAAQMTIQPARQAFAAALAALSARAPAGDDDMTEPHPAMLGMTAPIADTLLQAAVQQVSGADQGALDPRHDRGLHGMIDHIEALRDDANARDTRIRLTPDALGTVDVAVRRDGDAVHVRFSSTNEATRLVLGDAQPRLAALAEARGVRIAGSSIDSGTGGGGQPQPQPRSEAVRPARAPRGVMATDTDTPTDQRLA